MAEYPMVKIAENCIYYVSTHVLIDTDINSLDEVDLDFVWKVRVVARLGDFRGVGEVDVVRICDGESVTYDPDKVQSSTDTYDLSVDTTPEVIMDAVDNAKVLARVALKNRIEYAMSVHEKVKKLP